MKYVFTGPSNEYGHCCGLGIDAKRQTFGEMQLQYGKTTINLHHHHANADDVNVIPSIEFLDTATFIGMIRPSCNQPDLMYDMGLGLCCDPDLLIEPDDLLIFIGPKSTPSKSPEMLSIAQGYVKKAQAMKSTFVPLSIDDDVSKKVKNTLICGWRAVWSVEPQRLQDRILQVARSCAAGSVMTFLNFVSLESFEELMSQINVFISQFAGDPCPIKGMEAPSRLYLMGPELGCRGVFIRHIVGDASVADTVEPIVFQTHINTAIVLGTQSAVRLPPRARDIRVVCIMLLLRKLCEKKISAGKEALPMHVVGENQEARSI